MVKVETMVGLLFIGCSLNSSHAAHLDVTKFINLNGILTQIVWPDIINNHELSAEATNKVTPMKAEVVIRNLTEAFLCKNQTVFNSSVSHPALLHSNVSLKIFLGDVSIIRLDFKTIVASVTIVDAANNQIKFPIRLRGNILSSSQTTVMLPVNSRRYFVTVKKFEKYTLLWNCSKNNNTSVPTAELATSKQINQLPLNVNYSTLTLWSYKITRIYVAGPKKLIIVGESGKTVVNVNNTELNVSSRLVVTPVLLVIFFVLIL